MADVARRNLQIRGAVEFVDGTHSAQLLFMFNIGGCVIEVTKVEALSFPYVFLDHEGGDDGGWSIGVVDLVDAFAAVPEFTGTMRGLDCALAEVNILIPPGSAPHRMIVMAPAVLRPCSTPTVEVRLMAPEGAAAFSVRVHYADGSFGDVNVSPPWDDTAAPLVDTAFRESSIDTASALAVAARVPEGTTYERFSWPAQESMGFAQF